MVSLNKFIEIDTSFWIISSRDVIISRSDPEELLDPVSISMKLIPWKKTGSSLLNAVRTVVVQDESH